jgi:hypothetical protein
MRFAGAEELDSMPSWRLVNSRDVEKFQVTVWVSTDHDLAPLRVRQVHLAETGEETAESEMRVTAYTPVGDSFLPASVIICGTNRYVSSYQMSTYDIEEVKVGPQHRPSSVLADLPRGTYVTDLVRMEHWTVGENGARANRQPVNLERRRAVEMARDAQVNLPRLKRTRGISIFLIGLGTAGIVVFTILAMRRRARA